MSEPDEAVITRLLAEHRSMRLGKLVDPRQWECWCGHELGPLGIDDMRLEEDHRTHVAAVLAAALLDRIERAETERDELRTRLWNAQEIVNERERTTRTAQENHQWCANNINRIADERDAARADLAALRAAVTNLADEWTYKGEFGWGPWQAGEGPDIEGQVLDQAASRLRALVDDAKDAPR